MSTQTSTDLTPGHATEIRMGRGLAAPQQAVPVAAAGPRRSRRRLALAGAALLSNVALAVQYGLNTAGLPRQDAEVYLAAVADAPGLMLASTVAYTVAMVTIVAVGAMVAVALGRRAPVASAATAALLTGAAVGGGGFVGLRLAALALVEDGAVVAGGVETFARLQTALIDPLALLLACGILGTVAMTVALGRARRDIGWWPAAAMVVGFVMASGEFPNAVSVAGALVQACALVPVARLLVRDER